jgi:hypothetical protein
MNTSDLIQARHLQRRAMVYIRQSSPSQVTTNLESQRMQYALRERAVMLGWHEQDVQTIDVDLGRSGATTDSRVGYQELVAQIALGEVGLLLAFDATRLARNCSHWYQLLDLCGRADCLIADRDGVYDPTSINGRLLLGLKGQISELELHTIRARLTAGDEQHAPTYAIPADLLELLKTIGPHLPDLWNAGLLKTSQKKSLLRSLVSKVVIHRVSHDQVQTRVVWRGGETTSTIVPLAFDGWRTLPSVVSSSHQHCLLSDFCTSGRDFAPRCLQTPSHDDALALR